jgi:hypothetical protein
MNLQSILNWAKTSPITKNAVNAALLSLMQMYHDPADNNFHNWHGIKGILWQMGAAVVAREGIVLIPKILKWSQTNGGVIIMKIFMVLALTLGITVSAMAQAPVAKKPQKHATVSVLTVAVAPVVHPVRTFKQVIGGVLFAGETGVDVVHALTSILDNGTVAPTTAPVAEDRIIAILHVPFHAVNTVVGKADTYTESAEQYLFGTSN